VQYLLDLYVLATSLVTIASVVCNYTETPKDDEFVAKAYKVLEQFAFLGNKAKKEHDMGEKKTTPIVINDKEYIFEDMTEQQQVMVNHCNDLDRKIRSTQFNLDQLSVGKDAFINMLVADLDKEEPGE
jgi:hypothetical protein